MGYVKTTLGLGISYDESDWYDIVLGIKTKTDSEYVMTMVTPYKGKPFDDAKTLINYVFDYLKEDEEYQKLLRENKLNRILN